MNWMLFIAVILKSGQAARPRDAARVRQLSVNQVAEPTGTSQPAASQQPALLRRGGTVASRRDGGVGQPPHIPTVNTLGLHSAVRADTAISPNPRMQRHQPRRPLHQLYDNSG